MIKIRKSMITSMTYDDCDNEEMVMVMIVIHCD